MPDAALTGLAPAVYERDAENCAAPKQNAEGCVDGITQRFSLSYIEFDDGGEFWSIGNQRGDRADKTANWPKSQLEDALQMIRWGQRAAKTRKQQLLVLAFVHGWHNDASPYDETKDQNLHSFKESLQRFATNAENCPATLQPDGQMRAVPCRVVIGIFLSWRGRLAKSLLFHPFTYANRRNTATRVGGVSMTEALFSLASATKGLSQPYQADTCEPQSDPDVAPNVFLVVGHSFGGRALMHGTAQALMSILLDRKALAEACVRQWKTTHKADEKPPAIRIVSPFDLVVLLNPADDAIQTKSIVEAFKREGITDRNMALPAILLVKSDGDFMTGVVMTAGQIVSGSKFRNRSYDRGIRHDALAEGQQPPVPSACEQGQLGLKVQRYYYDHSAGSIYNMASHVIAERGDLNKEEMCTAANAKGPNDRVFWGRPAAGARCYEVVPVRDILAADAGAYSKSTVWSGVNAQEFYSCPPTRVDGTGKPVAAWNDTPLYVMHAPKDMIKDHDDIFGLGVHDFLASFVLNDGQSLHPTATASANGITPIP